MSLLKATYTVLDTETTGLKQEDRAVSLALVRVVEGVVQDHSYYLLNPQLPIPPETTAIHGITDDDVKDAPTLDATLPDICTQVLTTNAYVAHNAPFDRRMVPGITSLPWIDTLVMAHLVYPDLESYRNEALREHLKLDCSAFVGNPHNALYDAQVTARLFLHLIPLFVEKYPMVTTIPQLVTFLEEEDAKPRLLTTCFLPKHKGKKWADVDSGYLQWIVNNYRGNASVLYTASYWLEKRSSASSTRTTPVCDRLGWKVGASKRF